MQSDAGNPTPGKGLSALPLPKPLSYGVEIEAIVHYVLNDEKDPLGHIEGLPEPIRVDLRERRKTLGNPTFYLTNEQLIDQSCQEALTKTLKKYNIPTEGTRIICKSPESLEHHVAQERLEKAGRWVVTNDGTIQVPKNPRNCRFLGVEIKTSVEADSPESFEMLKFVINCLSNEHRLSVNSNCGLHVHVGNGAEAFSLDLIRRISALLWSAEPLVDTVHPPSRRMNYWCAPLRTASRLADPGAPYDRKGESSPACPYHGGDVRFGERSMGWRELHAHKDTVDSYLQSRGSENNFQPWLDDDAAMEYRHNDTIYSPYEETEKEEMEKKIKKYEELAEIFRGVDHAEPSHSYSFIIPEKTQGPDSSESSESSSNISPEDSEGSSEASAAYEDMLSQQQLANRVADLPKDRMFNPTAPRRLTNRPYCTGSKFTKQDLERVHMEWKDWMVSDPPVEPESMDSATKKPAENMAGVIRLLESKSSCEIARLLYVPDNGFGMMAYNFNMYDCRSSQAGERHTIEFRQAESSLDTAWVATWAKVCVGLIKFAINAPPDSFMQVITNCDLAERREKTGREYDVVDLLGQVGLIAEANVVAERMWQHREEWRLSYSEVDGGDSDDNHHPSNQPGGRGGSDPGDGPDSGGDDDSKPGGGQSDDNSKKSDPNTNGSTESNNQRNPEQESKRPVEPRGTPKTGNPDGERPEIETEKPETQKTVHDEEDKIDTFQPVESLENLESNSKKKNETGQTTDEDISNIDGLNEIDGLDSDFDAGNATGTASNAGQDPSTPIEIRPPLPFMGFGPTSTSSRSSVSRSQVSRPQSATGTVLGLGAATSNFNWLQRRDTGNSQASAGIQAGASQEVEGGQVESAGEHKENQAPNETQGKATCFPQ